MIAEAASQQPAARDHGFHGISVARVVRETADTSSFVLDVPAELQAAFAYRAGQFCTFRVTVDGQQHLRCYSMSSSPDVDDEFMVTVKRVPTGAVSNWLNDHVAAGDELSVTCPAGVFGLAAAEGAGEVVACAAGSGITPVLSIVKSALATTDRLVRLLYANRDQASIIFRRELEELAAAHGDRLRVEHHLDIERGFVEQARVGELLDACDDVDLYLCGPGPFMDLVERAALAHGIGSERIHVERFDPAMPGESDDASTEPSSSSATHVTIELDGKVGETEHRAGTTILQTARQMGMAPPFSCESGSCATCMARLRSGEVSMFVNNALTEDEVAEGWILTCQSVPTTPEVRVVYGFEED